MNDIPMFDKIKIPNDIYETEVKYVSGYEFFKFFQLKRLKLGLAWGSGIVGVIGNYYAVKYQLTQTRIDMMADPETLELYAFGLTALLDLMIVVFHLMRINILTIGSTASAIIISIYANVNLIISQQSISQVKLESSNNLQYGGSIIISVIMSALPILILTYLMHLVMLQYDSELKIAYKKMGLENEK
jgi:hypothetical protein